MARQSKLLNMWKERNSRIFTDAVYTVTFCSSAIANETLLWIGELSGAQQLQQPGIQDATEECGAYN